MSEHKFREAMMKLEAEQYTTTHATLVAAVKDPHNLDNIGPHLTDREAEVACEAFKFAIDFIINTCIKTTMSPQTVAVAMLQTPIKSGQAGWRQNLRNTLESGRVKLKLMAHGAQPGYQQAVSAIQKQTGVEVKIDA